MSKEILIIKHIEIEGPGSIEDFFRNTAWGLRIIELSRGGRLPANFNEIEAIISLGGLMNVYEEDRFPFLKYECDLLKQAIKEEIPILGICLGAQLLAKACGARIKKAQTKEIGWHKVNLTEAGRNDPLFKNLPAQLDVFQWHEDTFEIPEGGLHLAESISCANQAFRFGRNAYGIQFHIEVAPDMIESWINKYVKKEAIEFDTEDMLIESRKIMGIFKKQSDMVCLNFSRIITASQEINVD